MISRDPMLTEEINPLHGLPDRWRHERLHNLASLWTSNVNKKSEEDENPVQLCNYTDVYYNDRITAEVEFMQATASAAEIERFSLEPGDVVITKDSESPDDIGVPALIAEKIEDLVCGYHLTILRPFESVIDGGYLFYALVSRFSAYQFYLAANGVTRFGLTYQGTKNLRIAFPPLPAQKQITNFLDHKTTQIDVLIAKKKELIEKLKEQRTAVITQAITKGLNPNAPMRDSGTEWFGEIPEHWKVMQLRRRFDIYDCKHKTVSFVNDGIPLASIREVHDFEVNLAGANKTTEEEYLSMIEGNRQPQLGDIIYSRNATVGDAAIVTTSERFCMGQDVCLLRSSEQCSRFVAFLLRSYPLREQAEALMIGSTFNRVNVGQIKGFWVVLPPVEEQIAIAHFLDVRTSKIDLMIGKVKAAINRLTEYRTALITAATTGKIDVRGIKLNDSK